MRILVTGSSGFLGQHLIRALSSRKDDELHLLVRKALHLPRCTIHIGDIRDKSRVDEVFKLVRPEWVFHLAADINRGRDEHLYEELFVTNAIGTHTVVSAAAHAEVLAFVGVGTFEEYGDARTPFLEDGEVRPASPYGVSKAAATLFTTSYGRSILPSTVLRLPVLYGAGMSDQSFLGRLIAASRGAQKVPLSTGLQQRDFLHAKEAVSALILAAKNIDQCSGEVMNICSGNALSLLSVVALAEKLCGKAALAQVGAYPERKFEQYSYVGSNNKARVLIDWEPHISFEHGLSEILL